MTDNSIVLTLAGIIGLLVIGILSGAIIIVVRLFKSQDDQVHDLHVQRDKVHAENVTLNGRLVALQDQLTLQQQELDALQSRSRQPGPTLAGLEDARSVTERLRYNRVIEDDLLEALANTLGKLRQGPHAYQSKPIRTQRGFQTTIKQQVKSIPPSATPHIQGCEATKYLSVELGVQAVIHLAGSDALVIVGNPNNGDQPAIITRSNGDQSTLRLPNCEG